MALLGEPDLLPLAHGVHRENPFAVFAVFAEIMPDLSMTSSGTKVIVL